MGFALVSAPLSGLVLGLAQGEMGGLVSILGAIFVSSLAGTLAAVWAGILTSGGMYK